MKLAAVYNVFDGEELLEGSILSIRTEVDCVIAVCQTVSNFGEENNELRAIIQKLVENKLIDHVIWYKPDLNATPKENEIRKRTKGAEFALAKEYTHFIHMDTDEYYDREEFKKAKTYIMTHNIKSSLCEMYSFFKEPIYQMVPKEDFYVPFIHQLSEDILYARPYPYLVDPTRSIAKKNKRNVISRLWKKKYIPLTKSEVHLFPESELNMYHYSFIRKDITSKVNNRTNRTSDEVINHFLKMWENWTPGVTFKKPAKGAIIEYDVIKVENKFNIKV